MSKLKEIEVRRENELKEHNEVLEKLSKDKELVLKEFEKQVRKLIKGVKFEINHSSIELTLKTKKNATTLMFYNFDTFSFENIERDVAYKVKDLYDELYGYPEEDKGLYQISYTPSIGDYIFKLTKG